MGRKPKGKRDVRGAASAAAAAAPPNWPLVALSSVGIVLTAYLSYTAWAGSGVQGCAEGSGCDAVLSSRWATLLGVPTSVWGLLTYATLAALAFARAAERRWRRAWTIAFIGLAYSLYLTTISLTVLQATCPYCLTSLALMTAIFALLTFQRPALPRFAWRPTILRTAIGAVALVAALHVNYSGYLGDPIGEENPTARDLAIHLSKTGARMYGAKWCPHCQQQKDLFGASASRLPYVECSPNGQRAPQAEACRSAGIKVYPTWVISGVRTEALLTLQQLAAASGFPPSAAAKE